MITQWTKTWGETNSGMTIISKEISPVSPSGNLIVFAGAGISAVEPSSLPDWKLLNRSIMEVLTSRLVSALGWGPSRLDQWTELAVRMQNEDRFPPEYQAQIIEEMCGERYFKGLQSLDVDAINQCHQGIASLAAAGALKAIVTTNFDRLLERALDKLRVPYEVAFDEPGYLSITARLEKERGKTVPIIKIHGCVSSHLSMIDTLKQRQQGRSKNLENALDAIGIGSWLYLGFSAADLETDHDYLNILNRARASNGGTYVARPSKPELGKGAQILMNGHGDSGTVERAEISDFLNSLCKSFGLKNDKAVNTNGESGLTQFKIKLEEWGRTLSPASAGLCLSAVYEAVGNAEGAVRLLDRLVRKELSSEKDSLDFRALQLHYGRLGASWARFIAVSDLNGVASNASVETVQSLLRLYDSELQVPARIWAAILYLWLNQGAEALKEARRLISGCTIAQPSQSDEEAIDGWISAAQIFLVDAGEVSLKAVQETVDAASDRAKSSGDIVRTARVAGLYLLSLGRTQIDMFAEMENYTTVFDRAMRVGDGFALGFRELAIGRWCVGAGGLPLGATTGPRIPTMALEHLQRANSFFLQQGMDAWMIYSNVQMIKALGDLHRFDEAEQSFERMKPELQRFPIFNAHMCEAVSQLLRMQGLPNANQWLLKGIQSADASGLYGFRDLLLLQYAQFKSGDMT